MSARLDERASALAGEPLEAFPVALAERGAPEPAWTVSDAAWRFLWASRSRGLQGGRDRRSPEAQELRTALLMTPFGAPSTAAEPLLAILGAATSTLIATVRTADRTDSWRCWFRGDAALVDVAIGSEAGPSVAASHGLSVVPVGVALAGLLDALRIAPAWTFAGDGAYRIPDAAIAARIADEHAPAPDCGAALRHAWSAGPWAEVLVADQDRRGVLAIRTDSGWWRRTPNGDRTTTLFPLPSAALVADLLALSPARPHA